MKRYWGKLHLDNRGSAMIMALTVISLIAILGAMAMGTALLNLKMRSLNKSSDKNFYLLETALDEIYAQIGRLSGEILKEEYASVMGKLYQEGFENNQEANQAMRREVVKRLAGEFGAAFPISGASGEEDRKRAAERLKELSDTLERDNLTITVDSVLIQRQQPELLKSFSPEEETYSSFILKGVRLTYINQETQAESSLTVDIKIKTPYVRFINEGDALMDYILVANKGITVGGGGARLDGENVYTGSIYGGSVTVDNALLTTAGRLMTAAGNLTIKNRGELTLGPDTEQGGSCRVWADGIELNMASSLKADNTSIFVKDDLTLKNNENFVQLSGSYYGYGNEGADAIRKETPEKSSSILLNDKNSTIDFSALDSLILAGRAYLRFNSGENKNSSPFVYPLGESLAVRATQVVYLIPSEYIYVIGENEEKRPSGTNPVVYPDDRERIVIEVALPDNAGGLSRPARTGRFEVSRAEAFGESAGPVGGAAGDVSSPAFPIALNGKIYFYYNFSSETERARYFEYYLEEKGDAFDKLLENGRVTGVEGEGGVFINTGGRISTSGSLYQVAGNGKDDHRFEVIPDARQSENTSSGFSWVEFAASLDESFSNLKENLDETDRVKGRAEGEGTGGDFVLPAGNYVRLDKVKELQNPAYWEAGDCRIFISKEDVTLKLKSSGNQVFSDGEDKGMESGLIVSAGNVTVEGDGSFEGLIISAGAIHIKGNAILTADAQTYRPLLDSADMAVMESSKNREHPADEEQESDRDTSKKSLAADYFYDYSDAASTVLNDYRDFVIRENWSRSGRENGSDESSDKSGSGAAEDDKKETVVGEERKGKEEKGGAGE